MSRCLCKTVWDTEYRSHSRWAAARVRKDGGGGAAEILSPEADLDAGSGATAARTNFCADAGRNAIWMAFRGLASCDLSNPTQEPASSDGARPIFSGAKATTLTTSACRWSAPLSSTASSPLPFPDRHRQRVHRQYADAPGSRLYLRRPVRCRLAPSNHPTSAPTWEADVETLHRLIEDEFYEVESFSSRLDFLAKTTIYLLWFNTLGEKQSKHHRSPWRSRTTGSSLPKQILTLLPLFFSELHNKLLELPAPRGDDLYSVSLFLSPSA